VARLRKVPGKSKVVLLLTDGVNNQGLVDPRTAAQAAEAFGVRVYTVGVGTEGEARIPTGTVSGGVHYEMMPVRIDEPLLTDIAGRTGGKYFRAKDSEALKRIFQQVDKLERTPVDMVRYSKAEERTLPFVAVGLILLALELWLSGTLVVRVP
jgi:Ca-activated chloride channel family protein